VNNRLQPLEEKVAYLERHVAEQDKAMLELAEDLARLRKQLLTVRERLAASGPGETEESAADDRPPHY